MAVRRKSTAVTTFESSMREKMRLISCQDYVQANHSGKMKIKVYHVSVPSVLPHHNDSRIRCRLYYSAWGGNDVLLYISHFRNTLWQAAGMSFAVFDVRLDSRSGCFLALCKDETSIN